MAQPSILPLLPARESRIIGWSLIYCLLVAGTFTFPLMPSAGLDPSWRMALGYFFENGMQFGRDVVFTYGPLGFIMGKTVSGYQFWNLIAGQLVLALVSAAVILRQGLRLDSPARLIYFLFFFLFGLIYEDALHMLVLAILGFELLRLVDEPRPLATAAIAAVLAGYSQIKFTDCLFTGYVILVTLGYGLWRWRRWTAVLPGLCYAAVFLAIWIACGQSLQNLPAYFRGSWEISQGYQWAMGFPSPFAPLWKALVILAVIAGYLLAHIIISSNKARACANTLMLGAYIYLNWKHGFVRADGHMIGFFFCALLPVVAYPVLLDDPDRFRRAHRWTFAVTIFLAVWGTESALQDTVRNALGGAAWKIWDNVEHTVNWQATRQRYRDELAAARGVSDLPQTRKLVGQSTLDVIGCEQSVALFNKFNYRPRPVIQGYSTFTPVLARLNGDFFASERAPEFVLTRFETIDGRLLSMDDAQVLQLLPYRYEYVLSERSFMLWRRLSAPFDPTLVAPKSLRVENATVNQPLPVHDLAGKPIWVQVDLQPSLLGQIRSFLYKPPQVMLNIADIDGGNRDYLMPLPQGRNGFILNPVIGDTVDYMRYASNQPVRFARTITVKIAEPDTRFFDETARVELFALPALVTSGEKYFPKDMDRLFPMFRTRPLAYESHTPYSVAKIDDRNVAIMHAPSLMTFTMPDGAKYMSGSFGLMPATYTGEGRTNGARFIVYWSNGSERKDLFQQYLNPLNIIEDRGLHHFKVDLTGISGGNLYLEVHPGPFNDLGWDWTGWTDIYISR